MNRALSLCAVLFCAVPLPSSAEEPGLEQQLAGVNAEYSIAQQVNSELKTQLTVRETEVSELRVKLKQIEDQIETLKQALPAVSN